jgi:antirestriction factor ArdC-like protein
VHRAGRPATRLVVPSSQRMPATRWSSHKDIAAKALSDEERDARREADRDRIEQAARALLITDGWQRWIKVRARNSLSRYSVNNQLLVAIEAHARGITPTYVAGFRAFLDLNRCVRKGEKAIRILGPVAVKQRDEHGEETGEKKVFFRTVPVFDTLSRDC